VQHHHIFDGVFKSFFFSGINAEAFFEGEKESTTHYFFGFWAMGEMRVHIPSQVVLFLSPSHFRELVLMC
jgi:hypothetical protein